MIQPTIGILGLGFLGLEIARLASWSEASWGTKLGRPMVTPEENFPLRLFSFDWQASEQWEKLPSHPTALILTIPPIYTEVDKEIERLKRWGDWMNHQRPQSKTLVYISTTGVYPNRDGHWDETSQFEPDSSRGLLRLATEKTLSEFFKLKVLRAGAIYGKNRHLGQRIISGRPIPEGNHPVHRIHVTDLANIVRQSLIQDSFPDLINAVDQGPAPTATIAEWILKQNFKGIPSGIKLSFKSGFSTRKNLPPIDTRFISNRRLVETCHYQFKYPTYAEGFRSIYSKKSG